MRHEAGIKPMCGDAFLSRMSEVGVKTQQSFDKDGQFQPGNLEQATFEA